jgi:hypothetical protein
MPGHSHPSQECTDTSFLGRETLSLCKGHLVSAPCVTSDNGHYVHLAGLDCVALPAVSVHRGWERGSVLDEQAQPPSL